MEKYYPPFQIIEILKQEDRTIVKVIFWKIDRDKFNNNLVLKDRGGEKPQRLNANVGGVVDSIEIFELPKMNSEEARKEVYSRIEKSKRSKKVII